jgi:hypothetical protein
MTFDPVTQLACVFSALIHDVDHQGVLNAQLVAEKIDIAAFYGGRSIAEQNSVDVAWALLMVDDYVDLRAAIYGGEGEKVRFRQLVVNSVMATGIMDKDLKKRPEWSLEQGFYRTFGRRGRVAYRCNQPQGNDCH